MPSAKALESIECPKCGCRHNCVIETRVIESNFGGIPRTTIRRLRQCRNCQKSYRTSEKVEVESENLAAETETVVFNNLNVVNMMPPRSPLDPIIVDSPVAPVPARNDIVTQAALEKLKNPYTSPKEEDAPLRGAENGSLGGQQKPKKPKKKGPR
jgi:hypothetical protein